MLIYTMLSYSNLIFISFFWMMQNLPVVIQWAVLSEAWRKVIPHASAPLTQLSCTNAFRKCPRFDLNFVNAISVTFVLFLPSFRNSFVLVVKHSIPVVRDWRFWCLSSLHFFFFFLWSKANAFLDLKKEDERRKPGPVLSSSGNRR